MEFGAQLESNRLMTTAEFCRLAGGIQPQTARLWRMRGTGPRFVRIGDPPFGRVYYRVDDVRRWLEERSARSTAEEHVRAEARRRSRCSEQQQDDHAVGDARSDGRL